MDSNAKAQVRRQGLLRRSWHVASIVVLCALPSCALAQSVAEPLPLTQEQTSADQLASTDDQLRAIASELRAIREEAAQREQGQKASELKVWGDTIPNWVSLVIGFVGVGSAIYTLVLLTRQTESARRAADMANRNAIAALANARAAKDQAKATADQVALAASTFVVIKGHRVDRTDNKFGTPIRIIPSYRIVNGSNNLARNLSVTAIYGFMDAMDHRSEATLTNLPPDKSFWLELSLDGDDLTPTWNSLLQQKGWIRCQITIEWIDPIGKRSIDTLNRRLVYRSDKGWVSVRLDNTYDTGEEPDQSQRTRT